MWLSKFIDRKTKPQIEEANLLVSELCEAKKANKEAAQRLRLALTSEPGFVSVKAIVGRR